jgi:lysophospholipase L1-like esterase
LLFYRHARLGHALVRSYDYFGWVHVNAHGFRGAEVVEGKRPGVTRIMAVGGSTTFDSFVSGDERAWPARLAFWLHQLAPEQPIEVINAGVPGYRVIDDLIRLQTELYRFKPDVIILYATHNDLIGALAFAARHREAGAEPPTATPGEVPVVTPWEHWLSRHSMLYSKVLFRWKALNLSWEGRRLNANVSASVDTSEALLERGIDQFERDLTSYLVVARILGIRVVVPEVAHISGTGTLVEADPSLRTVWRTVPFASVSAVLATYHRYGQRIRAATDRLGVTFIPTAAFGLRGAEWYSEGDPMHFNDLGADRMGEAMARALLEANVLGPASPPGAAQDLAGPRLGKAGVGSSVGTRRGE